MMEDTTKDGMGSIASVRTLVIGDIHGEIDKLKQVLERCKYEDKDFVVSIGDIVDRGPDPIGCMKILHDLKHVVHIQGNHDEAFKISLKTGVHIIGEDHGSKITVDQYNESDQPTKEFVKRFLMLQRPYYIDRHNYLYVHGGFDPYMAIKKQSERILCWDRTLWQTARVMDARGQKVLPTVDGFDKIFIGHTPTTWWGVETPLRKTNIYNVDTGAGKGGKLSIMEVQTNEYWQSD